MNVGTWFPCPTVIADCKMVVVGLMFDIFCDAACDLAIICGCLLLALVTGPVRIGGLKTEDPFNCDPLLVVANHAVPWAGLGVLAGLTNACLKCKSIRIIYTNK